MPDQTTPRLGDSVADLASSETIRDRVVALAKPVEEAAAGFRALGQQLRERDGHTSEEWRQVGDGVRAMADSVAVLGIGSFVKAAAEAETKRVLDERKEADRA